MKRTIPTPTRPLLILLISLIPHTGFGQPGAATEAPVRNILFTAIRFGPDLGELNYATLNVEKDQRKSVEEQVDVRSIYIPTGTDSALYAYKGPSPMVFFREKKDEEGVVVREPVASVNIPKDAKNLLLFVFISEDQSQVRVVSLRDDAQQFEEGEFLFWNLSGQEVAAHIADEMALIPKGEYKKLKPDLAANAYYPARFFFRADTSEEWTSFKNTAWTYRPSQRVLMILFPGESPERPPRLFVRANRPPPPPPTPEPPSP